MKRSTIFGCAAVTLALAAALTACTTTEKLGYNNSTATGLAAIPAEDLAAGYRLDAEEALVTANFAAAHNAPWSLARGEYYVQNGDVSMRLIKGITGRTQAAATLLGSDEGDQIVALDMGIGSDDFLNTISFDVSDNGNNPQDLSQSIIRLKVYVPMELAYNNDDAFNGTINFQITDVSGNVSRFEGLLENVSFRDFGTGWKTISFNLAHQTFYLGRKTGTFDLSDANALTKAKSFDITVQGKSVQSNLDVPLLIDWIDFASLPER